MKSYIINQLTQITAWIGILLIIAAFALPREYIAFFGIALFFVHDESIKNWITKRAPFIAKFFEDLVE